MEKFITDHYYTTLGILLLLCIGGILLLINQRFRERSRQNKQYELLLDFRKVVTSSFTKDELESAVNLYKKIIPDINKNDSSQAKHLWYSIGILSGKTTMLGHMKQPTIAIISRDEDSFGNNPITS